MFMGKYKDVLIIGSFLFVIILGNFLLSINQTKKDELTLVKDKIKNTNRIIIAIGEQKQIENDNKNFTYDYHDNNYEIIEEITDENDVKNIVDVIMNVNESPKDSILTSNFSTKLFQLYYKNKKIAEFNFQNITIGYITNVRVSLNQNAKENLNKYFDNYYKLRRF